MLSLGGGQTLPEDPIRALPPRAAAAFVTLVDQAPTLKPVVLARALTAVLAARQVGFGIKRPFFSVIDFDRPPEERRLWVFDLKSRQLIFHDYVAHGIGSGAEVATHFSNREGSLASSVGLYVTRETYKGRKGLSLRLIGLDPGFNDWAYRRRVVMHSARYMSATYQAEQGGRFGHSEGCPVLRPERAREIIPILSGGSLIFAHGTDEAWLSQSAWLRGSEPYDLRAQPRRRRLHARRRPRAKTPGKL